MSSDSSEKPVPRRSSPHVRRTIIGKRGLVYEIERRLGRGGMAETFLVRRRAIGRISFVYCLKRMRVGDDAKEFLDEAYITSLLQHDNIARAWDSDVDKSGKGFICMEFIDGVDLSQLLRHCASEQRRISPRLATHIVVELLQALAYAHELCDEDGPLHVVHRDVTPANVMLSRYGAVKLTDFGIARFRARPSYTRKGTVKGNIPYMSPEHFDPSRGFDARTDLFSLGVTWFEMLTGGVLPYGERRNDALVLEALYSHRIRSLRKLAPGVDRKIVSLVNRMLSPNKDDRPESAREVLEIMRGWPREIDGRDGLRLEVERCLTARAKANVRPITDEHDEDDDAPEDPPGELEHADGAGPTKKAAAPGTADRAKQFNGHAPPTAAMPAAPKRARALRARTHGSRRALHAGAGLVALTLLAGGVAALSRTTVTPTPPTETSVKATGSAIPTAPKPLESATAFLSARVQTADTPTDASASPAEAHDASHAEEAAPRERARTAAAAMRPRTGGLVVYVRAPKAVVWVNGVRQPPRRPLTLDHLAPGRYRIAASEDEAVPPQVRTDAQVSVGKTTEVRLELPKPF